MEEKIQNETVKDHDVALRHNYISNLKPIIAWEAPSTIHYQKGWIWYLVAGLITIGMILYFVLIDAPAGAIATLLLAGVYFLTTTIESQQIKIELNDLGVKVGKEFYPFSSIRFFWIEYTPPISSQIKFATIGKMGRIIKVQLDKQDPADVRNYLRTQIPEVEGRKEGFFEVLRKILRI